MPPVRSLLLSLLTLLLLSVGATAQTATLRDITVTRSGSRATVTILLDGAVRTAVTERMAGGAAQIRMRPVSASREALGSARPRAGVRSVKARIERTDVLVINAFFTDPVKTVSVRERKSGRIIVDVVLKPPTRPATRSAPPKPSRPNISTRPAAQTSRRKATIVIDAGHGGYDPGAIGRDSVKEKVITLAVARKLKAELLKLNPKLTVIMTRSDDRYVALDRRAAYANRIGADMFISIHCNWSSNGSGATGFEVYIPRSPVRPDTTSRDAAGLRRLFDYRKRQARCAASRRLASAIAERFRGDLTLGDRGIYEAGFVVLLGTTMPAVLVELGYISHPGDCRLLRSPAEQSHFARSLARGILRALEKKPAGS